jgi:hypothetical protein
MTRLITGALLVLAAAWPLPAFGGVLIVEKTTTADAAPQTQRVQIDQNWMRAEHQMSGERHIVIFDGVKETMWTVNADRKTYTETTKADVDRLGGQMSDAMAKLQESLKDVPPQHRAMVEAMMRGQNVGRPAQRAVYRKTGTDKVGAWTCDTYEGYLNDQKTSELCTVDPAVLGFLPADFEVSRKLAEFFKKLVPQNADSLFSLGKPEEQGFSGVPVRRVSWIGKRQTTTETTEVSRQTFPASTWELPPGLTKKTWGER